MNRDIPWPKVPEQLSYKAYDLIDNEITKGQLGESIITFDNSESIKVKQHPFFEDINWETLTRQKAAFIPSADDEQDTSYFMSRHVWNSSDEFAHDNTTDTTGSTSCSSLLSDPLDEENLSQLVSINIDLAEKSSRDMPKSSKPPIP
ncbi:hypothetical protein ACLOJK_000119 [Asimina triloba]